MKNKHICIFTQSPLNKAPRVVKEANAYAKKEYKVTVYGLWYDTKLVTSDRTLLDQRILYKAGIDLLDWNSFKAIKIRLIRKLGRFLVRYFKIETISALGYDFNNYLKKLEQEKADIYVGHEEMSMALAQKLIKKNYKVAFDFEDWHSKDLLPQDRVYRPIQLLENLEKFLLDNALYCYTTSETMAKSMSEFYNSRIPSVVYNSFLAAERKQIDGLFKDKQKSNIVSLYWFSQVVSSGRGLELLFDALQYTQQVFELHLRGAISSAYKDELLLKLPSKIKLFIHDLVLPSELISRIAEHDLGLAFEEAIPENKNLTISNKIFHYLQSGIGIIATETAGQLEVTIKAPQAVCVVERDPKLLAQLIDKLVLDKLKMKEMKLASWVAGETIFAYENSEKILIKLLQNETR